MRPGDLVRLSEYGIARDYNLAITREDPYQIGVVTRVLLGSYPYKVHWMKAARWRGCLVNAHSRKELKHAV